MQGYDVIIVGTGAGGGTLLRRLAPTGLRILVLERGGYLRREAENWRTRSVFTEGRYKADEVWRDAAGKEFHPGIHYGVGGQTKVYGAALLRLRERDFERLEHHGGASPAWPLRYDDFESYYTEAERLYHVHGERGADPTEPWASAPYAHPPVSHEPVVAELAARMRKQGLHPFPLPVGVMLDEKNPERSPCVRCATCDGFPCLVDAKADAHVVGVRPSLPHPNVTLLLGAKVVKLETDAGGGRVSSVVVERDGVTERYEGGIVVLSCGAANSAAVLLRSANDRHPKGLANASGVVGRHYMCHHNTALLALTREKNPTVFQKTLAMNDWYFGDEEFRAPMGHVQMLGKSDAEMLRGDAPKGTPGALLRAMAAHSLDFWLTSEDLPDPENRIRLGRDGGIELHYRENNLAGHRRLVARLKALLRAMGYRSLVGGPLLLDKKIPIAGVAHQCGTVRFGTDPRNSALNPDCRAHDVENLYVVDASFFPSSAAVNPGLTVMANALRVADHLLERLQAKALVGAAEGRLA